MIGYFEGIDSERGIAWRCADLFSLRDFLRLSNREKVPDLSWLSRTRSRLPHEAHETVFGWVLKLVAERGLVKGERIGVDGSTMEANAALRTIVRRDSGESYRAMLTRMAQESGIETPTAAGLGLSGILVCGAIMTPMEGAYGNQERPPGRFTGGA